MMRKRAITLTILVITVIILLILASAITISTYSSINYARLNTWASEIMYIQDAVTEAMTSTSVLPYTSETINIDTSSLSSEQITAQFSGEGIVSNKLELNILDLGILKITNTVYGNLANANDVYAYSTRTGRVYYVQGIDIGGDKYYSLTNDLKVRYDLKSENNNLSSIVFVPSTIGYTNQAITVTVKVPNTFTDISITTSNNEIVVGEQTTVGAMYEYLVNNTNVTGNYEITVTYTNNNQTYTSRYTVNGYDNSKPVITPLTEENFIVSEDESSTYLTNIEISDAEPIKYLKYSVGTIAEENAKQYFGANGNNIINGKINLDREATVYTIYVEDHAGNFAILTFDKSEYILAERPVPEEWQAYISKVTKDGVPIPKGFVASPYTDEAEVDEGLVIYALTETEITNGVTDITTIDGTQQTSLETRNQFVWVPVSRDNFTTEFVRDNFGKSYTLSNELGTNYWEIVLSATNMPESTQSTSYVSPATLQEATAMYESVKEYGGFYIGRYEAGGSEVDSTTKFGRGTLSVTMGKYPYNAVQWGTSMSNEVLTGGAVTLSRGMYLESNTKYGVVSTLTYGVQWDRTLNWIKSIKPESFSLTSSSEYGNYIDTTLEKDDFNTNAKYVTATYNSSSSTTGKYDVGTWTNGTSFTTRNGNYIMTTGALSKANLCNIYDMAGNMYEWTMEGRSNSDRVRRGGDFNSAGSRYPVVFRGYSDPAVVYANYGFRPSLYIKK